VRDRRALIAANHPARRYHRVVTQGAIVGARGANAAE